MKKTIILSIGIIILVVAGFKIFFTSKAQVDLYGEKSVALCFYDSQKTNSGLFDRAWMRINIDGEKIAGEFQNLPAEKDSKIGKFSGVVGPLIPEIMGRRIDAWWEARAEGTVVTEELVVEFGDGNAKAYFAEMIDRGDGVYVYKNKNNLSYGINMGQIACEDLEEILEENKSENIINLDEKPASALGSGEEKKIMKATLHTNKGDITLELFDTETPNTVANFVKLSKDGFYDGVKFHRVIEGFMIQGGDPLTKDDSKKALWGTGGPGYKFADEIGAPNNNQNKNDVGTIAMANSGPNTNGSQFFINVAANNFLDSKHTVFGKVVAGMDAVRAIESTPTDDSDRPIQPVVINSISLE